AHFRPVRERLNYVPSSRPGLIHRQRVNHISVIGYFLGFLLSGYLTTASAAASSEYECRITIVRKATDAMSVRDFSRLVSLERRRLSECALYLSEEDWASTMDALALGHSLMVSMPRLW